MKKIIYLLLIIFSVLTSCSNEKIEFPNFDYTTVYFPYQSPVRSIILGTDYVFDNSLDTAHQCMIYATMGGVYSNDVNRILDVQVDTTLCKNLTFGNATGAKVRPLPSNYYQLIPVSPSTSANQIVIPSGSFMGGVKVQLTDAFFADPLALSNNYVIPMKITKVANADSILLGKSYLTSPNPFVASDWVTVPKNYVLYAVKYKNPWDGVYLRRGIEVTTGSGQDTTYIYHQKYVESDQVITAVSSVALNKLLISLNAKIKGNLNVPFQLLLTFDNNGNCTITNPATATYTVAGTGEYKKKCDMFGNNVQRDALHLNYTVNFGSTFHTMKDTLVLRDRVDKSETFSPFYNK
ncbi:MAG: DUF5627 domain-containing protein [Bacteroidota bacterium]|nr:DUF5627 domain-containing protein [Bacteroidota bacterium]MDP4226254.1 DUF5627 domain-containing protein [Bacteroidota bacterium]MDP4275798.1 DUF5627 domain-containing protein [Bacteroidota bacterium]